MLTQTMGQFVSQKVVQELRIYLCVATDRRVSRPCPVQANIAHTHCNAVGNMILKKIMKIKVK